ncbi:MAG: cytochrome ubiquinol oxidase subunit I [Alphaproteobacteria bacterium]
MMDLGSVDLSRLQFAFTAMYHFLFVPLTLGLSFILAIMESVYVMTRQEIWKKMTQFWGILFGINFAMGVCTGVPLEFQFGTNWAYYSHYVGDVFGSILAIEGLMAFFLEATFLGLFFFGWTRLSPFAHLMVTWVLAIGSNLSALWILVANAWMQNPVGAHFNPETLRMELTSFYEVLFNPVAQSKFVHTVSAGYVTGAVFVLAISSLYLLRNKHVDFAKRSMAVAASFGLAAALSAAVLGDESGYTLTDQQQMKIAAIEAMWETKPAPAPFTAFAIPDQATQTNHYEIEIPWLMGLIATRSLDKQILGIHDLVKQTEKRIYKGLEVYRALEKARKNPSDAPSRKLLVEKSEDLGHALLLKKYTPDILKATPEQVKQAALDTIPSVLPLFFAFRIMVGCGFFFILLFGFAFYLTSKDAFTRHPWFLRLALFSLPLPWIAAEMGWLVAEHGRQPWTIDGILPTFLSASQVSEVSVLTTLIAFALFYTILAIVDVFLMVKYIRLGPDKALA